MRRRGSTALGWLILAGGIAVQANAGAATMQKVNQSDWWAGVTGLPSYVNMYVYAPDKLAAKPPIVVVPHHCQGTAQSSYSETATLVSIADKTGFLIIFPEATGENCWDAGSARSLKHGGGGDTGAVVQMVKYALSKYSADAARVYSVGGSSGGIMTEALLGVYPDVFMAGVSLMGVPCGCWADGYNDVTGSGSSAQWSGNCAGGSVTKTGQAWGDLVRSYDPGYTGHRPRLQHWHGTADTTLNFKVMAEDVKEWTNLLGLSETPTGSDTPASGTAHQFWKNSCGYTVYETFALSGVAHAVPFDGKAVAAYFGLDTATTVDPETAACGSGSGGMGSGGVGGVSGIGGRDVGGAGSGSASAGRAGMGAGGVAGGTEAGIGGATAMGTGGATSLGGANSGDGGSGGVTAAGGPSAGGSAPVAEAGRMNGAGGVAGASGVNQSGATATSGGASAGRASTAGTSSVANGAGAAASNGGESSGCGCVVAGNARRGGVHSVALLLAALGLSYRRRAASRAVRRRA
jgi:poly(hydroxyalkanoate) depolymerase family esterase